MSVRECENVCVQACECEEGQGDGQDEQCQWASAEDGPPAAAPGSAGVTRSLSG